MLATNAMLVFSIYFDRSVGHGRCVCLCMAIFLICGVPDLKSFWAKTKSIQCLFELCMRLLSNEDYLFKIHTLIRK